MPKRTNDFQELVALIHQALAGKNAQVTESAMVPTTGMPYEREVDVLIESNVEPYRIKIAVEARDHTRRLDVTQIDEIIAKYQGAGSISVNKVIIVSRNGFTKQAEDKAALSAIELITLEELDENKCKQVLLPPASPMEGFQVGPFPREFELHPIPDAVKGCSPEEIKLVCKCKKCKGKGLGSVNAIAINHCNFVLALQPWYNQHLGFLKGRGGGAFTATVQFKPQHWVAIHGDDEWAVESFQYVAYTRWSTGSARGKIYSMTGDSIEPKLIQHNTVSGSGFNIDFVMTDPKHPEHSAMKLRIDSIDGE